MLAKRNFSEVFIGASSEGESFCRMGVCVFKNILEGKEGNVLFNNTLNTFYLWLYGKMPIIWFMTNT